LFLLALYLAEEFGKGNTKFLGTKWGEKITGLRQGRHIFTQNRFDLKWVKTALSTVRPFGKLRTSSSPTASNALTFRR
jgi:hypothetical protein